MGVDDPLDPGEFCPYNRLRNWNLKGALRRRVPQSPQDRRETADSSTMPFTAAMCGTDIPRPTAPPDCSCLWDVGFHRHLSSRPRTDGTPAYVTAFPVHASSRSAHSVGAATNTSMLSPE